ncbi:hypothetical protein EVAR_4191_1 [Eumeta japonica]|uniref:Uncharacterized protein n=1 Tax=Eumeta variegata TaxID=151549 RepID=A0A4C1TH34_EUMVA|nr:hypothetical protein EVAR_4191_1 [Eumeta japonica]
MQYYPFLTRKETDIHVTAKSLDLPVVLNQHGRRINSFIFCVDRRQCQSRSRFPFRSWSHFNFVADSTLVFDPNPALNFASGTVFDFRPSPVPDFALRPVPSPFNFDFATYQSQFGCERSRSAPQSQSTKVCSQSRRSFVTIIPLRVYDRPIAPTPARSAVVACDLWFSARTRCCHVTTPRRTDDIRYCANTKDI